MIILVIGDFHIPQRSLVLPDQFQEILKPGKVHRILCVGNLTTNDTLKWLKSICKDVICVSGDLDDQMPDVKETQTVKINNLTFGLIHGHQVCPWGDPERLAAIAREMNVDILISGQTHEPKISTYEGRLFLNPGSATGAYSNTSSTSRPSFMVLDVRKDQLIVYQYLLNESDELEVLQYNHSMV